MSHNSHNSHIQRLMSNRRQRVEQFAELVADTGSVKLAGAALGVSPATATDLMAQVRREMGAQAI